MSGNVLYFGIMEKNVTESLTRHDRYEYEMVFCYPAVPWPGKRHEYHVDTYFFLPKSLGIDSETYTTEMFYRDSRHYIRLRTPVVRLKKINSPGGPLTRLENVMRRVASGGEEVTAEFRDSTKLFCSIWKSALREEGRRLFSMAEQPDFAEKFRNFQSDIDEALRGFRRLEGILDSPSVTEEERMWFRHADEFVSLLADKARRWQYQELQKISGSGALREMLSGLVAAGTEYRKERHYPSVPEQNGDNELLLYRESALKKIMSSVLFLHVSRKKDGVLLENLCFGLAAAIAMTMVTAVSFAWHGLLLEQFSLTFFMIWVLAYVGKDRMKDLLKWYFKTRLHKYLYDYRTELTGIRGRRVGCCRTGVGFEKEEHLPDRIRRMRGRTYLGNLENAETPETVFHARKLVTLYPCKADCFCSDLNVHGFVDIMRFNVRHFLEHMDNPVREILIPDGRKMRPVKGRKVYHVNVIVVCSDGTGSDMVKHFRLVLARRGIRRIESVPETPEAGIMAD